MSDRIKNKREATLPLFSCLPLSSIAVSSLLFLIVFLTGSLDCIILMGG